MFFWFCIWLYYVVLFGPWHDLFSALNGMFVGCIPVPVAITYCVHFCKGSLTLQNLFGIDLKFQNAKQCNIVQPLEGNLTGGWTGWCKALWCRWQLLLGESFTRISTQTSWAIRWRTLVSCVMHEHKTNNYSVNWKLINVFGVVLFTLFPPHFIEQDEQVSDVQHSWGQRCVRDRGLKYT